MTFLPGFEPPPEVAKPTAEDDDWYTPQWLLDWLPPIGLDPCYARKSNVRACDVIDATQGGNGLTEPWQIHWPAEPGAIVFCNPPYSDCARWVQRCAEQAITPVKREVVVALIPAKPGEIYWHEWIWDKAFAIGFIRGRVAFDTVAGPGQAAGVFTSALVVWGASAPATRAHNAIRDRSHGHKQQPHWVFCR